MSQQLQYNYAIIIVETGFCGACITASNETIHPSYIEVPYATNDYMGKYYNAENGMWYWDAEFTQLWEECPSHNA